MVVSCFGEKLTSQMEIALSAESFAFVGSIQFILFRPLKEWVGQGRPGEARFGLLDSLSEGASALQVWIREARPSLRFWGKLDLCGLLPHHHTVGPWLTDLGKTHNTVPVQAAVVRAPPPLSGWSEAIVMSVWMSNPVRLLSPTLPA